MSLLEKMMQAQKMKESNSNEKIPKNIKLTSVESKPNPFKNIKSSSNPFLKKMAEKQHENEVQQEKINEKISESEQKEELIIKDENININEIENNVNEVKKDIEEDKNVVEQKENMSSKDNVSVEENKEEDIAKDNVEKSSVKNEDTEEKEEVNEEIKKTNSEENKEEESKKPTKKRHTSKKKTASKPSLESTELENVKHSNVDIFGMKMSFEEAAEILYANFVSPEWIEFRNSVSKELEDIKITSDINPGTIKVITEELNILNDKIAIPLSHVKSLINIVSDKDCGIGTVKKTEAAVYSESTNAVSRAKAGFDALQEVDFNGEKINLLAVLLSAKVRCAFLEGIKERIEFKRQSLMLIASALKTEAGLTY